MDGNTGNRRRTGMTVV